MDDDSPPGVAEWVVTYGDMMSLLLTFFIMLVSLSEVVADQKYRAILDAMQQYIGYRTAPAAPEGQNFPLNSLLEQLTTLGSYSDTETGHGGIRTPGVHGDDFRVWRTREGAARVVGAITFADGSAELSTDASAALEEACRAIAGKPNKIELRVHVRRAAYLARSAAAGDDLRDLPYWRGRRLLDFLVERGIDSRRLRLSAVLAAEPAEASEPVASGDRAEVLIVDALAAEFVGPRLHSD